MRSRVYETGERPSVCRSVCPSVRPSVRLSVCPIDRPPQLRRTAGLLAIAPPRAGDVGRLLHGAPAAGAGAQQQRRHSKALGSKCGQLNSTQQRTTDASKSVSSLYTIINERYQFMTSSDRFPVPVRSAVKSNFTNWCCRNLSKRTLNALTVILTVIWYYITHSLFLSRLKTFLLCKFFPLQPFLSFTYIFTTWIPWTVYCYF